MWPPAAPGSQDWVQRADRIACGHMSGLLSRSHVTAAKMGSATRDPNIAAALQAAHGFRGEFSRLGIDRSRRLLRVKQAFRPRRAERRVAKLFVSLSLFDHVDHPFVLTDGRFSKRCAQPPSRLAVAGSGP